MFKRNKNNAVESIEYASNTFYSAIHTQFIQHICELAQDEGLDVAKAGIAALVHGIVILYWELEKAVKTGHLVKETSVQLKTRTLQAFIDLTNSADGPQMSQEDIKTFIVWIYSIYDELCAEGKSEQEILDAIAASVMDVTELKTEKNVKYLVSQLDRFIGRHIIKNQIG